MYFMPKFLGKFLPRRDYPPQTPRKPVPYDSPNVPYPPMGSEEQGFGMLVRYIMPRALERYEKGEPIRRIDMTITGGIDRARRVYGLLVGATRNRLQFLIDEGILTLGVVEEWNDGVGFLVNSEGTVMVREPHDSGKPHGIIMLRRAGRGLVEGWKGIADQCKRERRPITNIADLLTESSQVA